MSTDVMPFELLYGVDIAIKKLRPGADFGLAGNNITDWNDPNDLPPPTWEEIQQQIEKDKRVVEEWKEKNKHIPYIHNVL